MTLIKFLLMAILMALIVNIILIYMLMTFMTKVGGLWDRMLQIEKAVAQLSEDEFSYESAPKPRKGIIGEA